MCLDPRPDSLFRVRSSSCRIATRPAISMRRTVTPVGQPTAHQLAWTASDDLDLRGWTLITRTTAELPAS